MPCRKGQTKPMQKQANTGRMNSGNQRWMGRRISWLFTADPSRFFFFLCKLIFLSLLNFSYKVQAQLRLCAVSGPCLRPTKKTQGWAFAQPCRNQTLFF